MRASKRLINLLTGDYNGTYRVGYSDLEPIQVELEAMGVEFSKKNPPEPREPTDAELQEMVEAIQRYCRSNRGAGKELGRMRAAWHEVARQLKEVR